MVSGRHYLREWRAIASTGRSFSASDRLEGGGFVLSAETIASLRALDLLGQNFRVKGRALVLDRDDLATDGALTRHLSVQGLTNDAAAIAVAAARLGAGALGEALVIGVARSRGFAIRLARP